MTILTDLFPTFPIRHPVWCDPRGCSTTSWDHDGTVLVIHSAVLLVDGARSVEARQADEVAPGGTLVASAPAVVTVRGYGDVELTPAQAVELAGAIAAAAAVAGGVYAGGKG